MGPRNDEAAHDLLSTLCPPISKNDHSMEKRIDRVWRAFRTRPRHEKAAADRLEQNGIEVYCPLLETKVKWSDRWKKVKKPLFNGYLFARVHEKERIEVLEDSSVSHCVMYLGKPGVIRDEEIQAIRFILEDSDDVQVVEFQPGQNVKVAHGAFRGAKGEVITVSGTRVRVRLETLGMEIIANITAAKLETMPSSAKQDT